MNDVWILQTKGCFPPPAMTLGPESWSGILEKQPLVGILRKQPLVGILEGLGMWTGDSETLSVKLGRATASGLLRFGSDKTIPYFRLGIGGQVASVAGSSEASAFFSFGAGIDRRLSEDVVLGAGISWDESNTDDADFRRSIAFTAHLSYGWNTGGRDK